MIEDIELICRLNKNWQRNNIKIKRAGGQTNRNYVVEFENKKYFVRLPWERAYKTPFVLGIIWGSVILVAR
jgi:hypothetical protein